MASKWKHRDESKKISDSVVKSKTTEELIQARDFIETLLKLRKLEKLYKTYIMGTTKAITYNDQNKVYVSFLFTLSPEIKSTI